MKITKFHHVSVNISDAPLDDMVSFYGDLFGLDSKDRPDIPGVPGHWFHVADQELHVVGAPPRGTSIDSTGNHYCVAVEDLDKAILELEERKHPLRAGRAGGGHRADLDQRPGGEHDRVAAGPSGAEAVVRIRIRIRISDPFGSARSFPHSFSFPYPSSFRPCPSRR